jgi:hypothetical protein
MTQIYCNINLNTSQGDSPQPLKREYVRSSPILTNRGDYHVAIVRANFPLSSVWLWNPEMALGVNPGVKPVQTVYYISLIYNSLPGPTIKSASIPLNLIVTNSYASVGADYTNGLKEQPAGIYTAIYDYQTIADMYNNAFAAAFASLQVNVTAAGYTFPTTAEAPFMSFNSSTGQYLITLTDYQNYGTNMTAGNIDIYFSASLLSYLDGYQLMVHNPRPKAISSLGQYFDVMLKVPTEQNKQPTDPIVVNQQWSASYVYHALQSILVLVNGLGVIQENVDRPLYDNTGSAQANNWTSAIVTDFTPDLSTIGAFRNPLVYNASSVIPGARFAKILGGGPLSSFQINIVWIDALGRQHDLTTNSTQQAASVKLCFCPSSFLEKSTKA